MLIFEGESMLKQEIKDQIGILITSAAKLLETNTDKSLEEAHAALNLSRDHRWDYGICISYLYTGLAYYYKNSFTEAFEHYKKALEIVVFLNDDFLTRKIYNNFGLLHSRWSNEEEALKCYKKAIEHSKKANNDTEYVTSLINIANSYCHLNRINEAIDLVMEAYNIAVKQNYLLLMAKITFSLGDFFYQKQDDLNAKIWLEKSFEMYQRNQNFRKTIYPLNILANIDLNKGDFTEADEKLKTIFQRITAYNAQYDSVLPYLTKARMMIQQKNFYEAEKILNYILNLCEENKYKCYLSRIYKKLIKLYKENNNYEKAFFYQEIFTEHQLKLNSILAYNNMEYLLFENKLEQNRLETEKLKEQIELIIKQKKEISEAQEQIVELEQKNAVLALAVTTNHEINQPLTIIQSSIEMIKIKDKEQSITKYLDKIDNSVFRIHATIKKLQNIEKVSLKNYLNKEKMLDLQEIPNNN